MNTIKLRCDLYRLAHLFGWGLFLLLGQTTAAQTCTGEVLNISTTVPSQTGTTGSWTVPSGGPYLIRVTTKGAKGGGSNSGNGGKGATLMGNFIVLSGQILAAKAGAPGFDTYYGGSGGDGSGVQIQGGNYFQVAGAGGGGGQDLNGKDGLITSNGSNGNNPYSILGGIGGTNGTDGGNGSMSHKPGVSYGFGGKGVFNGFIGGRNGNSSYGEGSGGGGGYSGGGGTGGSGGSYNLGSNQTNTAGDNNGGGQVIIECLGTATYSATVTPTQPTCTQSGSISIDFTGDFNNNTSGGLEYAIVAGNSFTGTPTFADVTTDPLNVTSGTGTTVGTYTVRIRLKYNPTVYVDKTYTLTRPCNCTFYVNANATGGNNGSSWADAFTSLQDALETVCSGGEIWVAKGTYYPTADASGNKTPANARTKAFVMKSGVKIYGGFAGSETTLSERTSTVMMANKSILSGDLNNDDATTGKAENSYHVIYNNSNGLNAVNSLLDGFTITGGNANMVVDGYDNNTGGGMYNASSSPSLVNCVFWGNQAVYGGGMGTIGISSPSLVNCIFLGNQASDYGGGIFNVQSSTSCVNCSFSGNQANREGGAVYNYSLAFLSFKNCILWGNSSEVVNALGASSTYTNTLIKGMAVGGFQGTEDPLFFSQPAVGLGTTGDLHLQPCSPAINAGNNADNTTTIDLDGNQRKVGVIDLGVYEYQSVSTTISPTVGTSNPTTCGGTNGSITLGGFLNNTTYSVAYKKNDTAVSAANFTADGNGVITLTSLGAGNYTDIIATSGVCVSNAATASLQDPAKPAITLSTIPAICAGTTSFTIPYSAPTGSPSKYSISGTGIVAVSDGDLSNPITVALSSPASGSSISFKLTVKNSITNCVSDDITGSVMVNPVSVGGTVSSTQTICSGTSPLDLSLSGQTGNVVKWQKSSDANFSTPIDIASTATTLPSATIGNLTGDTYFRAVVKSGVCSEAISSTVKITVNPVSVGGIVSSDQTICSGTSPLDLSLSGQTGSVVKWQKSSDANFSTPIDIASTATTLPSATIGNLTGDTYFRAVVKSGVCSEAISSSVKITVNPVSVGGTVSSAQTICSGTAPSDISLSGQTGNVVKWQKSSDANFSNAVDIASTATTLSSATIGNLTADTYFRAVVKSGVCSEAISSTVKITVNPVSVGGTVNSAQTICSGTSPLDLSLSGQTGSVVKWQKSSDANFSNAIDIASTATTLPSATIGNLTADTYFRAVVKSGVCSEAISSTVKITVNPVSVGGTVNSAQTICSGTAPSDISLSGQTGNVVKWQKSSDANFSNAIDIASTATTLSSATIGNLTADTYFRAVVKSGVCSEAISSTVKITVNSVSVGGTVNSAQTICSGTSPLDLSLSGQTGSVVKWQKSSDANFNNAVDIASTATTLPSATIGNLTSSTYFRAVVKSGVCSEVFSSSVLITVNPVSVGGTGSSAQTICSGTSPADLSLSGQTGNVVKWQKASDANFSNAVDIASTATTLPSATIGNLTADTYFRAVVKSGVCSEAYSFSVLIQIHRKPTITLSMLQQTLNEGNNQTFCDTDANPVNSLQFNLTNGCVVGTPVWRVQVGSGAWSDWSTNPPVTQLSNNRPYRYQAACDASCPVTYTSPISVQINYRASTPQQVSLVADGVPVIEGETKEVCNTEGNALIFNATCGAGEVLLYSVDGGDYSGVVPTQRVDDQFHNYRVRCRKSDGTPSCIESESGVMRLKINNGNGLGQVPVASLNVTSGCGTPVSFSGTASCGSLTTVWYNASTNVVLPTLPSQTPAETTSYYARCQSGGGCLSEKSNVVTFTVIPVGVAPVVSVSSEVVCAGTTVTVSANCPSGSTTSWNTGVTTPSFEVAFNNVTKQTYWAKCIFSGGCQSAESARKDVYWNAFVVTLINVGESKSGVKVNDRNAWSNQFVTRDGGPELAQSTQVSPTLYYVENVNKVAPRYWTINVDACALGTGGSLTFDLLATPETGVPQSFNTHENNAPYFMYANREGWTELYAQNHPAYGFYQDNGVGGNVYDLGLPKGLYKLGVRYWDQKGWGSIYPSTRKPQGNVLAYQEYWFRIQSKDGVGVGAARTAGEQGASDSELVPPSGRVVRPSDAARVRGLFVHPNPVTNILHLQVSDRKGQDVQAMLMDASGRELLQRQFVPETHTHQEEFEVSELPTGMYFLKVSTLEKQVTLKVIKVH